MAHVRQKSRQRHCGKRFLHSGNRELPSGVRIRGHGTGASKHPSSESHEPTDLQNGRYSSFERRCPAVILMNTSFMTGIASSRAASVKASKIWTSMCCGRRSGRRRRTPGANVSPGRSGGNVRTFLIPLNVRHLKAILKNWVSHSNSGQPHMSLGPGIPHVRLYARPPGQLGERRLRLEARRRRNVRFRGKGPDFWRACEPEGRCVAKRFVA